MRFLLATPKSEVTTIRIELYLPAIKPEHWDQKKYRAKTMRGAHGDRNRKLNLILNEYEFAVERIRDLYGSALTKDKF